VEISFRHLLCAQSMRWNYRNFR